MPGTNLKTHMQKSSLKDARPTKNRPASGTKAKSNVDPNVGELRWKVGQEG